jgi:hypothetical protein
LLRRITDSLGNRQGLFARCSVFKEQVHDPFRLELAQPSRPGRLSSDVF